MGFLKKFFQSDNEEKIEDFEQNDEINQYEDCIVESDVEVTDGITELTSDDLSEELTEDGEFSYDNYDEVCCPECGEYLGAGVEMCKSCGYGKTEQIITCPNCGRTDEDNLGFCTYCDFEFDSKD